MALLSALLNRPTASDRLLSLLPMLLSSAPSAPIAPSTSVDLNAPLVTRMGVTLQRPAMRSLIDIARQSDILPGIRELRYVTDSYRTYEQQADLYRRKPGLAAPPGSSLHEKGLAIDWGWATQYPELIRLLEAAGWNRFDPQKEPWHWSYRLVG